MPLMLDPLLDPAAPKTDYTRRCTVEEYFEIEARTGLRHEFCHGEIFPLDGPDTAPELMAGATKTHNQLLRNVARALKDTLGEDGPCRLYTENVRTLVVGARHYLYPDVVVKCAAAEKRDELTVRQPVVILEVLSDSTEARGRGWKMEQFINIPSLMQYMLVNQQRVLVESYTRGPGRSWLRESYQALGDEVPFPALKVAITVRAIYRRVQVPEFRLRRNPPPPSE